MKCFRYFSFVLFALLGVFFGSFIINQNDTYAVDDLVVNIPGQTSHRTIICNESSSSKCSSYKYAYFTFTCSVSPCSSNFAATITLNSQFSVQYSPYFQSFLLFDIFSLNRLQVESGTFNFLDSSDFLTVTLSENNPFSDSTPSGSIELTENGTYDVSQYAEAVVNVPTESVVQGDYHNDLVAINNSIIICAATCLVIYFFYCIYRMIIKNSGVK